jgi:hypothetical protein
MNTTISGSTTTETEDRLAIIELINRVALALDAKDWNGLGQLFTETVHTDRTSLTGGEPETVALADFVAGWRATLENLDAVNHLITGHVVELDGDEATCANNMQGIHVFANDAVGPIWTVGGRHDWGLKRTADGWRIERHKFTIQWATGDAQIVALAAAKGQS